MQANFPKCWGQTSCNLIKAVYNLNKITDFLSFPLNFSESANAVQEQVDTRAPSDQLTRSNNFIPLPGYDNNGQPGRLPQGD